MNDQLQREFTRDKVDEALFQMGLLKSPGPDGFGACFYQDFQNVSGDDVANVVLRFLNDELFDERINTTHIALIPKLESPSGVTDFGPISLCNVLYKIIAKTLANRLKKVLPEITSYNKSAFYTWQAYLR